MDIQIQEVKVQVKVSDAKQVKAFIALDFGTFVVRGFRVMESGYENSRGDKLWLTPPSYKGSFGKYHPIFFILEKNLWKELEEHIWDAYYKAIKEYHAQKYAVPAEDLEKL